MTSFSKFWTIPIHKTIKKLRDRFGLKWIRVRTAYKRYQNLREIFQSDLSSKILENIKSINLSDETCNCNKACMINNKCAYNGECRNKCIVYQVTCKQTKKVYIGNTQQNFKSRMDQHYNDVQLKIIKNKNSDSFAHHFSKRFKKKPTCKELRNSCNFKILWQGNPISLSKTFGKSSCRLCMKERILILEQSRRNSSNLINKCSEIYGSCRHKPCFHRLTISTDEASRQKEPKEIIQQNKPLSNHQITDKFCQLITHGKEKTVMLV